MTEATGRPRRSLLANPWVWAFFIGIVMLTAIRPFLQFEPDPPAVIGQVPGFELVDQNGDTFGSEDLAGDVYVASFFFTACPSLCPALMRSVAELRDRYEREGVSGVRMVSISVDPERDTPDRLLPYAESYAAERARWVMLTGEPESVRRVVEEGFRTAMGEREPIGGDLYDIAHTAKLVLVDPEGGIRGYYDADESGLDEVFHRSLHVLKSYR